MSEEKKDEVLGQEKDLDMDELDTVAGGKRCECFIGGGGATDSEDKLCACLVGGAGQNKHKDKNGDRCTCATGGYGI